MDAANFDPVRYYEGVDGDYSKNDMEADETNSELAEWPRAINPNSEEWFHSDPWQKEEHIQQVRKARLSRQQMMCDFTGCSMTVARAVWRKTLGI